MKVIDLSQIVSETSLIYPGDPDVDLMQVESMARGDSVNGEIVKAGVHSLTHLDSPGHQIKDGKLIQDYPLEKFVQKALLIELVDEKEIKQESRRSKLSQARGLLAYWGNKELGISGVELAQYFRITRSSVSSAIKRGNKIAHENDYRIF